MKIAWTTPLLVVMGVYCQTPAALAQDRAGTAWYFSGVEDILSQEDVHHTIKTRGPRKLRGSSCCTGFTVAFPTNDTFELLTNGCTVASGTVGKHGRGIRLLPSAPSVQVLRWWAENEVEEHWNAGVFGLGLALRWTEIPKVSLTAEARMVGDKPVGQFKMVLGLRGALQRINQGMKTGPATGDVRVRAKFRGVESAEPDGAEGDSEFACTYPPEVACDDETYDAVPRPAADYCYER